MAVMMTVVDTNRHTNLTIKQEPQSDDVHAEDVPLNTANQGQPLDDAEADLLLASFEHFVGLKISVLSNTWQCIYADAKEEHWQRLSGGKDELTTFHEINTVLSAMVEVILTEKGMRRQPLKRMIKALTTKLLHKLPKSEDNADQPVLTKTCYLDELHDLIYEIHKEAQEREQRKNASLMSAIRASNSHDHKSRFQCKCNKKHVLNCMGCVMLILCISSLIYGFRAVNEFQRFWSQFSPEKVNAECNDKYYDEFKNKEKRVDYNESFNGFTTIGIIQAVLFVVVPCIGYGIQCCKHHIEHSWVILFTLIFQFFFVLAWFIAFIGFLTFYNKVQEFCDENSSVYEDTMELYDWLYPLLIWEIVKDCFLLSVFCMIMLCLRFFK